MDVILQQFNVRAGPDDVDAQRCKVMFGGAEIADFKFFDPYVGLILNGEHPLPILRGEARCIEDGSFARVASESNKAVVGVARHIDAHQLLVGPTAHVHRTSGTGSVGSMLNCPPWSGLRAGVAILA